MVSPPLQTDTHRSRRLGIFPGVVQQDLQHLFQPTGVSMNGDAILNLTEKFQSLFKKYWLKGQESVRCQCAQVHRLQGQLSLVAVCPGQFQHLLHQGPAFCRDMVRILAENCA